jgi:hypothetical protein
METPAKEDGEVWTVETGDYPKCQILGSFDLYEDALACKRWADSQRTDPLESPALIDTMRHYRGGTWQPPTKIN